MRVEIKKGLTESRLAVSLFLFIFVMIIVSCSEKAIEKSNAKIQNDVHTTQKVNFMGQWMNEGKRELIIRDFVREFQFLHQDYEVNLKFPEEIGFDRYNTTSTHAFVEKILKQEKPEWDILLINDDFEGIGNFLQDTDWANRYLVDFSKYGELTRSTIPEINLEKVKDRWGGMIPGPFLEGQYWALWSNKNVCEKLGIEVKQFDMTFDDFLSYIKAANDYNQSHPDKIILFQEAGDWTTLFTVIQNLYLSILEGPCDVSKEKIEQYKLDAWYKTLQAIEQLSTYELLGDDWRSNKWADIKLGLLNEECLFFTNGSWMYNTWLTEDESKVMNCVPNEFPTFGKITPLYPSGYPVMWGVPKNAPNKEAAIKLLLAMSQPTMAESWVRNTKCPTGIKGNVASSNFGSDQYENFSFYIQKKYGSNTFKSQENSRYIFNEMHGYEPNYFLEVILGELTADEAMAKIHERFKVLGVTEYAPAVN